MTTSAILFHREPRGARWQLGALPPAVGTLTLLGWRLEPEPVDAGVPPPVAKVLARALTAVARVTFPSSSAGRPATAGWTARGGEWLCALGGGVRGRLAAAAQQRPAEPVLLSTREPETVLQLFDDPVYPWWLQGQVALLSAPAHALPPPDRISLTALLSDDWAGQAAALGVEGAVRPGVDGDVAGIWSRDALFADRILAILATETRAAGFACLEQEP
jgi:hypothetical protein